jgi:DNA polymerase II small subunit/DNA polymerase delta subunit B
VNREKNVHLLEILLFQEFVEFENVEQFQMEPAKMLIVEIALEKMFVIQQDSVFLQNNAKILVRV